MKLEQDLLRKTINNKFVIHFKTQLKLGVVFALSIKYVMLQLGLILF